MTRRITPTRMPAAADQYRRNGLWSNQLLSTFGQKLAASQPNAVAVVDRDRRLTFADVDAWSNRVAAFFRELGVQPGEVVTFQLPNWAEAIVVNQALLKLGAVSNPVIPIYHERELLFILNQAQSRVFVVPSIFRGFDYVEIARGLAREADALEHVVVVGESNAPEVVGLPGPDPARSTPIEPAVAPSPDDAVLLLYTSGTTAAAKGAIHSHNTLIAENRSMIDWFGWNSSDIIFMPSPVTHITGYLYGMLLPFMLGTRVALLDAWNPEQALDLVCSEGCTITVAATPFLQDLIDLALNASIAPGSIPLRTFACGGADVPPQLIADACDFGIGAGHVYGSTEYPTYSCYSAASTLEERSYTDGLPMSGEGRVVNDAGSPCPVGQIGELELRGPEAMLGYLDATLNADAFSPDGWFRTGDLVRIRPDGYVEVTGRKKDVINRGGEKISAKEVEDLLYQHPLVREVAVVAMPDDRLTERACAYVVPVDNDQPPTLEALIAFLAEARIAKQKYPERLEIIPSLPKTASGKIQKFVLRDDIRRKLGAS